MAFNELVRPQNCKNQDERIHELVSLQLSEEEKQTIKSDQLQKSLADRYFIKFQCNFKVFSHIGAHITYVKHTSVRTL